MFWILMMKMLKDWRETVHFVKPDTVVRWHRNGFRFYWRKKSKGKPGRPPISMAVIHLIRRMSIENETWGAPMIMSELALLGHLPAYSLCATPFGSAMDTLHLSADSRLPNAGISFSL